MCRLFTECIGIRSIDRPSLAWPLRRWKSVRFSVRALRVPPLPRSPSKDPRSHRPDLHDHVRHSHAIRAGSDGSVEQRDGRIKDKLMSGEIRGIGSVIGQ